MIVSRYLLSDNVWEIMDLRISHGPLILCVWDVDFKFSKVIHLKCSAVVRWRKIDRV